MATRSDPTGRTEEQSRDPAVGMDHPTVVPVNFEKRRRRGDDE